MSRTPALAPALFATPSARGSLRLLAKAGGATAIVALALLAASLAFSTKWPGAAVVGRHPGNAATGGAATSFQGLASSATMAPVLEESQPIRVSASGGDAAAAASMAIARPQVVHAKRAQGPASAVVLPDAAAKSATVPPGPGASTTKSNTVDLGI